jgi:hypothetical protein
LKFEFSTQNTLLQLFMGYWQYATLLRICRFITWTTLNIQASAVYVITSARAIVKTGLDAELDHQQFVFFQS